MSEPSFLHFLKRDNVNDHRAAAIDLQAEKAARPVAPCASYCYPAVLPTGEECVQGYIVASPTAQIKSLGKQQGYQLIKYPLSEMPCVWQTQEDNQCTE